MPETSFDTVKVASIFPIPRTLTKFGFQPRNTWTTPPVKQGDPPAIITFGPSTEKVFRGGATSTNPGIHTDEHWSGFAVASDFVTTACRFNVGMKDGGMPGIWIVGHVDTPLAREIRTVNDELELLIKENRDHERQGHCTMEIAEMEHRRWAAELEEMTRRQHIFFDIWATWGIQLAVTSPNDIIDMHRIAADWVGIKGHSWQKERGKEMLKACPYCFEYVNSQAVICAHCTKVIDPGRYAAMQAVEAEQIANYRPPQPAKGAKGQPVAV